MTPTPLFWFYLGVACVCIIISFLMANGINPGREIWWQLQRYRHKRSIAADKRRYGKQ